MTDSQDTKAILATLAEIRIAVARVEERLQRHDEERSLTAERVSALDRMVEDLRSRVDKAEGALTLAKWAGGAGGVAGLSGLIAALSSAGA